MNSKHILHPALVALVLLVSISSQGFSQLKLPFRKAKNTQGQIQSLQTNHGPWLIMCASFSGDSAEQDAKRLAMELQRHRLHTYLYKHEFNYSGAIHGIGWQKHESAHQKMAPKKMKVANKPVVNEVAVLVGDFSTLDSSKAQKTLQFLKTLQPDSLKNAKNSVDTSQNLREWRDYFKRISKTSEQKTKGPLGAAFLIANPLLPDEYLRREGLDEFVLKMNRGAKHSLLKCPKIYSVRVASFRGKSTFESTDIETGAAERMAIAADNAHLLTKELRKRGLEAYLFHDRFESYVCVGAFDYISQNGKNNPEMVKVINAFKADIEDLNVPNAIRPKALLTKKLRERKVVFDAQPVPVLVPRKSTRTAMRSNKGR